MKTIKDLPEFSRPREKLKEKGVGALRDGDLVAAIIGSGGSGSKGHDVRSLSRKVVNLIKEKKATCC